MIAVYVVIGIVAVIFAAIAILPSILKGESK
jgi:uncharacterized protein with PQ loop repeat